ncbi:aldo/keto reductase [Thermodesulfobacteriota bacterium]
MDEEKRKCSRRDFLKTAGAAGVGSILAAVGPVSGAKADEKTQHKTMPRRPFGNTGINVPILALGGIVDFTSNQILLKQALKMGVSYWDTASGYEGGKSEKGIGKYFSRYPEDRKKVFLVTKSRSHEPEGMTEELNRSLERMNTSYIDLFFMHSVKSAKSLAPHAKIKEWAEKKKKEGKIRLFGLSTHSNMEEVMLEASGFGWIDGIMMTYNYRVMNSERMKEAFDACVKSGIGLTAMKTQGGWSSRLFQDTDEAVQKVFDQFLERGFTPEQTKLKAVWENPGIASICSHMPSLTILMANVAAALNKTKISSNDMKLLDQYALKTASHYCAGCANLCETAVNGKVPVNDVMRYLMYSRSYGDKERAAALFRNIPEHIRNNLSSVDYSRAEKLCPQGIAIGKLILEASEEFA